MISKDILFDTSDAILNEEYEGFKEDYLVLHSLIRKYRPATFFEVGTNMGTGTNIICNAMILSGKETRWIARGDCKIYSLDLPTELCHKSLQHPISEGKGDKVGSNCKFPYIQLRGDSLTFDFSQYPCEGYFIDGEHDYSHVFHETVEILLLKPKLIIWHDTDMPEVMRGIKEAFTFTETNMQLTRVEDTRISFAV